METNAELFERLAQTKDEKEYRDVRNSIVEKNKSLAYWFAKRECAGVPQDKHDDIVQECFIGLIKATERFDPNRKTKFSAYAIWWMRHNTQFVKGSDTFGIITVPRYIRDIVLKTNVNAAYLNYAKEERTSEIVSGIDFAVQIHNARQVSLDDSPSEGHKGHELIGDAAPCPETLTLAREALNDVKKRICEIENELMAMTEKRRELLARRYGFLGHEPSDQAEVARQLGCSRQNVQQGEKRALEELVERTGLSEREIVESREDLQRLAEFLN